MIHETTRSFKMKPEEFKKWIDKVDYGVPVGTDFMLVTINPDFDPKQAIDSYGKEDDPHQYHAQFDLLFPTIHYFCGQEDSADVKEFKEYPSDPDSHSDKECWEMFNHTEQTLLKYVMTLNDSDGVQLWICHPPSQKPVRRLLNTTGKELRTYGVVVAVGVLLNFIQCRLNGDATRGIFFCPEPDDEGKDFTNEY